MRFCFPKTTNLKEAQDSLSFLLLPREKVFLRPVDNCFDITTSPNRTNLLEKFLRLRYPLIKDAKEPEKTPEPCQIELKSTRKKKMESTGINLGSQSAASMSSESVEEISNAKILLGIGKPGILDMDGRSLHIECNRGATGLFNLTFFYSEEYRSKVSSVVSVSAGELVRIAEITNDLNQKSKMLGLPESLYKDVQGKEEISYELSVR